MNEKEKQQKILDRVLGDLKHTPTMVSADKDELKKAKKRNDNYVNYVYILVGDGYLKELYYKDLII